MTILINDYTIPDDGNSFHFKDPMMEFEDTKQISVEQPQQFSSRAPAYPAAAAVGGGGCATAEYATGAAYQCYQQQQAYDPRQQPLQQQQQHMMQALSDVCKILFK